MPSHKDITPTRDLIHADFPINLEGHDVRGPDDHPGRAGGDFMHAGDGP
jgi:hypothetical protein